MKICGFHTFIPPHLSLNRTDLTSACCRSRNVRPRLRRTRPPLTRSPLASSLRPTEEQLPGGLRQFAEDHLRQRNGYALPDRAPHPGRGRQPHRGPPEHDPARGERAEPGGVALPEGADPGESDRVRAQAAGEHGSCSLLPQNPVIIWTPN